MIWLLPAALCSVTIAGIIKANEGRRGDRLLLAGANYIVASIISLAFVAGRLESPRAATLALGTLAGIDYVLGFLVLMAGIARGPLAVPVTVMRLSVAVPIAASMLIWAERPGGLQWAGIAIGAVAIVLFGTSLSRSSDSRNTGSGYWLLIVGLFVVMGIGDVLLKAFRELSPDADRLVFTWILFTVAAIFTWAVILVRRVPFDRRTFVLGLVLGVPNLFSTVFTLLALRSVPASVAFPFINIAVIAGSAVLAFVIWKESLDRLSLAGLALAFLALVLLPAG